MMFRLETPRLIIRTWTEKWVALGSAVLHAVWNLLLGRARDVQAAAAATFLLSVAVALPFAIVWWPR